MTFTFRKAVRERVSLLIALAGPTGCGKTFSALELATGLVAGTGKRIYAIDTEADRMLHYADRFDFEHGNLKPPFRPDAYREAIVAADEQPDCGAIVIDSGSHEYEGEGGIQDWAAELEQGEPRPGIADPEPWKKDHWIVQPVKSPGNWKEPKTAHKRMMGRLLQCRAHLIFCLRAEEKMLVTQETDAKGYKKTVIVPAADRPLLERWAPLCEKRFMYEMTASFLLLSDKPGVPIPIKLQDQHRGAFPEGERISRKSGEALAAWAHGGAAPRRDPAADVLAQAEAAAQKGSEAFTAFWKGLDRGNRAIIKPRMEEFKAIALAADQPADDDDDPFGRGGDTAPDQHGGDGVVDFGAKAPAGPFTVYDGTNRSGLEFERPAGFLAAFKPLLDAAENKRTVVERHKADLWRIVDLKGEDGARAWKLLEQYGEQQAGAA